MSYSTYFSSWSIILFAFDFLFNKRERLYIHSAVLDAEDKSPKVHSLVGAMRMEALC